MACGRCKKRYYCCPAHQERDWPTHSKYCKVYEDPPLRAPYMTVTVPLTLSQRIKLANSCIEDLFHCITVCSYPRRGIEGIWGIEYKGHARRGYVGMNYPVAALMFQAWCHLYRMHKSSLEQFRADLVAAMLTGRLQTFFQRRAMSQWGICVFCSELLRRDFHGISWDKGMHHILAGKLHSGLDW